MQRTILVTGGAGFIGSNFVLQRIAAGDRIVNLDRLTYAGNPGNLVSVESNPEHIFVHGGIEDGELVHELLLTWRPQAIINFAAESHVDRSIVTPEDFISTNLVGTFRLLHEVLSYYRGLDAAEQQRFRFLHVSTDEVYGSLSPTEHAFYGRASLPAEQSVLGFQGRQRSPGARLSTHIWTADCSQQIAPTITGHTSFRRS